MALLRGLRLAAAPRLGRRAPEAVHQALAARSTTRSTRSREIQRPRADGVTERPRWPMIVLRTPKGWTGPKEVDGLPVEGTWRSHQVPIADVREPRAPAPARGVAAELPARGALRRARPARPRARGARAERRAPHERQPARERRRCSCATSRCPTSATTRSRSPAPGADSSRGDPRARRLPPRRDRRQPARTSASSAPTRPPRTGSATSSRSPTAPGTPRRCRPTTTSRPTAA